MIEITINVDAGAYDIIVPAKFEFFLNKNGEIKQIYLPNVQLTKISESEKRPVGYENYRWVRRCGYIIFGRETIAPNQAARLVGIFKVLAELAPERLPALSNRLRGRSRCPLATHPSKIYPSAHLVRRAHAIAPGWYIDTNTDTLDKIAMIKNTCEFLDLEFGKDVILVD